MGLKKGYSLAVGATDLAYLLAAFEELNSCTLSVCLGMTGRKEKPDLRMIVSASTRETADADPALLDCVQSYLRAENMVSLEDAIISCLYRIDAALATRELEKKQTK